MQQSLQVSMSNSRLIFAVLFIATLVAGSSALIWEVGGEWYQGLNQPWFTPPNWLFGPVWTILYILMALSATRLIARGAGLAVGLWALQITLNTLWTPVFFGGYNLGAAFLYIAALWVVLLLNILVAWRVDKWSSIMLWPYLVWVSFASLLNYSFWMLN